MNYTHMRGKQRPVEERFWEKVEKTDSCWNWLASLTDKGYGRFGVSESQIVLAHRWVYETLIGPIPDGLPLDHTCFNRRCVNPDHLEPVTTAENVLRAAARITHCPQGHEYTEANTYIRGKGNGKRHCRACHREDMRRRRA